MASQIVVDPPPADTSPPSPRPSSVPTVSASRIAGTAGANACQATERPSVARGTPVATNAA